MTNHNKMPFNELPSNYPKCLYNSWDTLELGVVQLRYLDLHIPSLITIYELERPAILAQQQLKNITQSLDESNGDDYVLKGLFTLAISQFETMLNDLLINILQFYPEKLQMIKQPAQDERSQQLGVGQEQMLNGDMIRQVIESAVNRLAYSNLDNFLEKFVKVFAIDGAVLGLKQHTDLLIEYKETRNLLLHNNLKVNEIYLKKTRGVKRANIPGCKLPVDREYVQGALKLISELVDNIIIQIRTKYGKFTVLPLLKKIFDFNFTSPIIRFENFCHLNEATDIYDGPFNFPNGRSSSENIYLEFWRAQRMGTPVENYSLVRLSGGRKLAFLTEVFGEFRFPHW
jgi:hypothetical protein